MVIVQQPAPQRPDAKKGSWTSHVHLSGIKQLSAWTPQGLIKRSASISSRSASPHPSLSGSPAASKNGSTAVAGEEVDHAANSGEEDDQDGQFEMKDSLIQLLSGLYHDSAARKGRPTKAPKPVKRGSDDSLSATTPPVSDSSTLTPGLTSGSSDDEPDEEEDLASDTALSLLSSDHSHLEVADDSDTSETASSINGEVSKSSTAADLDISEAEGDSDTLTATKEKNDLTPSARSSLLPNTLDTENLQNDELGDAGSDDIHTLAFVKDKAGSWPVEGEEEVLLASVPAVQCRSVMIKGTLYLTNKRLVFYAWLALDKEADETTVLQEGVLTFNYPQKWKPSRRVYCVLSPYSVASYTSATDRLHPRSARSLSAFKEVTMDPNDPLRFKVEELNGSYRWVRTDTAEHTREWYNAMHAALFRYRYRSDHIVTSIPLSRVESYRFDEIMDFCKIMQFDVNCATPGIAHPEEEIRQVLLGLSRQSWHILPRIEDLLESNKLPEETRSAMIVKQPEVIISFDTGEQRHESDKLQSSSKNLAAEFVRAFGLEDKPEDLYIASVDVLRPYPDYGHIAVSKNYLCFWRKLLIGEDTKVRVSMSTIEDVFASKNYRLRVWTMTVQMHAAKDLRFEFHSEKTRDECIEQIERRLEEYHERHPAVDDSPPTSRRTSLASSASPGALRSGRSSSDSYSRNSDKWSPMLGNSRPATPASSIGTRSQPERQASEADPDIRIPAQALPCFGTIINLPASSQPKIPPRHFVLMTIGSRGDVQPYIALGKRLVQDGHRVTIACHEEYQGWAMSHGLEYKCIGGSPTALMQLSVEHKMFSPGFFRETLGKFRDWFDDLLRECWAACQEADVIIESPTAFAGIHVAEALGIPYYRAFTMPWTPTASYPQAFAPTLEAGAAYNVLSYSIFDKVLWQASASQINRWRKHVLRIKPTSFEKMQQRQVPFIYNFSQAVVPMPLDWSSNIHISGYWFLDQPDAGWEPEESLLAFMQRARNDNVPLIYVGFGSITIKDVEAVTEHIYEAALTADVRVILSKGWSARAKDGTERKIQLKDPPPNVYLVDAVPHDWLFPQIDAAMHHGGAGTTGASLRAGLPTIIKPFFGDQFFWSTRVQKLGVGIRLSSLAANDIAKAFTAATRNRIMQEKAEVVGRRIRAEDGCGDAIKFVYGLLSSAERQAKERHSRSMLRPEERLPTEDTEDEVSLKLATDRLKQVTIGYAPSSRSGYINPDSSRRASRVQS